MSCSLHSQRDLTLTLGTRTTDPPGDDSPVVTYELAQKPGVFVVKIVPANTGFAEFTRNSENKEMFIELMHFLNPASARKRR